MCASQEAVDLLLAGGRRRLNPTEAVVCADNLIYLLRDIKQVYNQRRLRKLF